MQTFSAPFAGDFKRRAALIAVLAAAGLIAAGCGGNTDGPRPVQDDHGHEHGHAHDHGAEEAKTGRITVYGIRHWLYIEHPFVLAKHPSPFTTHVTDLKTSEPRREGPITLRLHGDSGEPLEVLAKAPTRPGIYIPDLLFPNPGTWRVSVLIPSEDGAEEVPLPDITVFSSDQEIAKAPEVGEPSGTSFLLEQQWKIPFKTEPVRKEEGAILIPESAVVPKEGQSIAYVQVSGETFAERQLRIARREDGKVWVETGLYEGDRVVTRGADAIVLAPLEEHAHGEEDAVEMDPKIREAIGLTSELAIEGALQVTLDLYGWVRPRPQDRVDIHSPIPGVVRKVHKWPGERVESGDPLLTLDVPEWLQWQRDVLHVYHERERVTDLKTYAEGEGRAAVAKLLGEIRVAAAEADKLRRETELLAEAGAGAVSRREIETKRGELSVAEATLEAKRLQALSWGFSEDDLKAFVAGLALSESARKVLPPEVSTSIRQSEFDLEEAVHHSLFSEANLLAWGFLKESLERLRKGDTTAIETVLVLKSPRSGVLMDVDVTEQEAITDEQRLLQLVDYSKVHVEVEVSESEIKAVVNRKADAFPVHVPGLGDQILEGRFVYFDTSIHPDVRKAHLVIELDNPDGKLLRDGMAVTVAVPLERRSGVLHVPKKAVLSDGFEKVVFVDEGEHFHRTVVRTGLETLARTEVLSGLSPGDKVVVEGNRALLLAVSAPKEGAADHGHSH
ncbi:MAG: efflux RND transporter periplasmic adaptor subunit [Candidatus Omnitrophica bacterium]|nr:efflux RND transporter periplasmic adaptor subunit [Candidatus Omnitrophota bacterium]